jgi:hypothetical protein
MQGLCQSQVGRLLSAEFSPRRRALLWHAAISIARTRRRCRASDCRAALLVKEYNIPHDDGYVDACHLCFRRASAAESISAVPRVATGVWDGVKRCPRRSGALSHAASKHSFAFFVEFEYNGARQIHGDSASMKLMTIGYQGLQSKQFFDVLLSNKVETIVDLRELPLSRKLGFSKSALETSAKRHKLNYIHFPALGSPRTIRHDYRDDANWTRFSHRYLAYLDTQNEALQELAELVQNERCCLLCFESDPNFCHRSFVVQRVVKLASSPLTIANLKVPYQTRVGTLHLSQT